MLDAASLRLIGLVDRRMDDEVMRLGTEEPNPNCCELFPRGGIVRSAASRSLPPSAGVVGGRCEDAMLGADELRSNVI